MIVSMDAGRSALKIVNDDWVKLRVPSAHGIVTKDFLKTSIVKRPELITSVPDYNKNDEMWIIGKSAIERLKSDQIIEVDETKEFLKNSTIYMLSALTEVCPDDTEKIHLLTQLTSNDIKLYGKGLKKALDGFKGVRRYDSFGDLVGSFQYEIESDVYIQGMCAYFDLLFDKDGNADEDLMKETVLVVDIGHKTTDIVLVKGLGIAAVGSYPAGSGSIFFSISDELRKEQVTMAAKDIEWRLIEQRYEIKSRTNQFDIRDLMKNSADKVSQRLVNYTLQEFASETIDRVILTGGSSILFYDAFKASWPFCVQPTDPQFSNANGALKWKMFGDNIK